MKIIYIKTGRCRCRPHTNSNNTNFDWSSSQPAQFPPSYCRYFGDLPATANNHTHPTTIHIFRQIPVFRLSVAAHSRLSPHHSRPSMVVLPSPLRSHIVTFMYVWCSLLPPFSAPLRPTIPIRSMLLLLAGAVFATGRKRQK